MSTTAMAVSQNTQKLTTVSKVKNLFSDNTEIKERVQQMLADNSQAFITSVLNVVSVPAFSKVEPFSIVKAAMVSASMKLPIDPNLGFAAIVPYKEVAQFQIMYKGLIQLAIRTGQYQTIHVTEVYKDELEFYNPLIGEIKFTPMDTWKQRYEDDGEVIGYYSYFKLLTGFEKGLYMSKKEMEKHARKYSSSYRYDLNNGKNSSKWTTEFDPMGKKTVLKLNLGKYGILSIEMQKALAYDQAKIKGGFDSPEPEYIDNDGGPEVEISDVIEAEVVNPTDQLPV